VQSNQIRQFAAQPPLQPGNNPAANVQGLAAPSFDDLRRKFDQNVNINSIQSAGNQLASNLKGAGNQLAENLAANLKPVQDQLNQFKQSVPDLSQTQSAIVQAVDQSRDEGLINALKSEFNGASDALPSLSSANDSQAISVEAPATLNFDANVAVEQAASQTTTPEGNDFSLDLATQTQELTADSEFTAMPIGSENDSVNSLASSHRSEAAEIQVQQANVAPDSLSQKSPSMNLEAAWSEVDRLVAAKEFRAALGLLTRYYRQADLPPAQSKRLYEWLDALAGKVIYSAEHHFQDTPYVIRSGETLNQIAGRWNVPAQVVYNINRQQIGDSPTIVAGTELKVINGPFHAEVNLSKKTLTLFLKNLYAGRFPIRVGISGETRPGQFRVVAKSAHGHTWRDADGNDFPPESSENGYGPYWIGLTGSLCLHAIEDGTPEAHAGCIGLKEKDARDIFGILINGSELKILK
jgi:LysM repeat protein